MRQNRLKNKSSVDSVLRSSSNRYSNDSSSYTNKYYNRSTYHRNTSRTVTSPNKKKETVYNILDNKRSGSRLSNRSKSTITSKITSSTPKKPSVVTSGLRRSPRLKEKYGTTNNDYSSRNKYYNNTSKINMSDEEFLKQYRSTLHKYATPNTNSTSSRYSTSSRRSVSRSRKSNMLHHPYY